MSVDLVSRYINTNVAETAWLIGEERDGALDEHVSELFACHLSTSGLRYEPRMTPEPTTSAQTEVMYRLIIPARMLSRFSSSARVGKLNTLWHNFVAISFEHG